MYTETSSNNHGTNVFCIFEKFDIIQISNKTLYYYRFSGENEHKAVGRFQIQLMLEDEKWSTGYNLPKMIGIVIFQLNGF